MRINSKGKTSDKSKKVQQRGNPFKKGESGNPNGRPKGSKNYKTIAFEERLESLGCDPVKVLATICNNENEETNLRLNAAKELASFVYPKRKAVEHSGAIAKTNPMEMSDAELLAIAEGDNGQ